MHNKSRHYCRGDAGGFDGYNFVDAGVGEESSKLFANLVHQLGVHLVVDEAIHL